MSNLAKFLTTLTNLKLYNAYIIYSQTADNTTDIKEKERLVDMQKFKSGQKAPSRGSYKIVGVRGKQIRSGISLSKGESFPPTPSIGQHFEKE